MTVGRPTAYSEVGVAHLTVNEHIIDIGPIIYYYYYSYFRTSRALLRPATYVKTHQISHARQKCAKFLYLIGPGTLR